MSNIDHDYLFKTLISTFFVEFLELFYPKVLENLDTQSIEFLNTETFNTELETEVKKNKKSIADIVVKAKVKNEDSFFIINIEHESSKKNDFNERFFKYFCKLYLKHNLPVYPIAIFSYDTPKTKPKDKFKIEFFDDETILEFQYKTILLSSLNWQEYIESKNAIALALSSKMKMQRRDRPILKADTFGNLTKLNLENDKRKLAFLFIDTYLYLNIEEKPIFQERLNQILQREENQMLDNIITSWERDGIEKGKIEGKIEGELKGKQDTVIKLTSRKFPSITEDEIALIKSLEANNIDLLIEELLDFQSKEELNNWLRNK